MLISIQYARALAAWLVVWAHMSGFTISAPLGGFDFGGIGVDVFFVISGFIMWETASEQTPSTFTIRRIVRVVPAYWFYTALIIALNIAAPKLTPRVQTDLPQVISSFLFIPHVNQRGELNPILLQGWTVNYEMYFYLVFGLALLLKRRVAKFLVVGVFFAVSALVGVLFEPRGNLFEVYTSSILLEFVLGMGLGVVAHRLRCGRLSSLALCVAGVASMFLGDLFAPSAALRVIGYGLPAAIFLCGFMGFEAVFRRRPIRIMVALGSGSYSLYLVHPFVLSTAAILIRIIAARAALTPLMTALGFACIAVVGCASASLLSYRFIELPMSRFLTEFFVRRASTENGDGATKQAVR